ncbi:hypothetical protein PoB_000664900 [Plakobranchus ocellatus]|uniref:Zasp-like motif domain-containing protein n=1 Tax=Plakobranchus ocellatus TaxID=259542 RepID=A0AAV3YAV5_9GAST|nr:hypothetical protein PoB_000664900 [Plakobranchus ocellatus]
MHGLQEHAVFSHKLFGSQRAGHSQALQEGSAALGGQEILGSPTYSSDSVKEDVNRTVESFKQNEIKAVDVHVRKYSPEP